MDSGQASHAALRVLLAFDSFKGSLSATEACRASAALLRERFGDRVLVTEMPLADGGEGSLELLRMREQLDAVVVRTVDAIGRPHEAEYLLNRVGRTAYIEVARVIGLPAVSDVRLRPLEASSYGVGRVVANALDQGAQRIVVFLGGSATTDGGAGLVTALGAKLLDENGVALGPGGGALLSLSEVDLSGLRADASAAKWEFVVDVLAPLTGPTGAALSYSPQKGARTDEAAGLETALTHAATLLEGLSSSQLRDRRGMGAAGGMQLFPTALFQTQTTPGGPFLAHETGALAALERSDLVVTGEGRFDAQSLDGKVVGTLVEAVELLRSRPPIVVVTGDSRAAAHLREAGALEGIAGAFGIAESAADLAGLQADAAGLISRRVADVVSVALATGAR